MYVLLVPSDDTMAHNWNIYILYKIYTVVCMYVYECVLLFPLALIIIFGLNIMLLNYRHIFIESANAEGVSLLFATL
jgi:hypothetical protein